MNIIEVSTLSVTMMFLAAMPSTSVALVMTRSATLGVGNGVAVAAGIVLGDLVFIILAILGLSIVAETMGNLFTIIKYLGAIYLLLFGVSLLLKKPRARISTSGVKEKGNLITSFFAGFVLTLGDIKAIFFYVSLFPMFIDVDALQVVDVLTIVFVTVASVGGVKIVYAFLARKISDMVRKTKFEKIVKNTAGGLMVGAGSYIILKT